MKQLHILFLLLSAQLTAFAGTLEPSAVMRTETMIMTQLLEQFHYSQRPLSGLPYEKILQDYLTLLDPQKMFFSEKIVQDFLKKYKYSQEVMWRGGCLTPGFEMFASLNQLIQQRMHWISNRLSNPFDFKTQAGYEYDRKNAPWPDSLFQLDQLWEKRLQHELLNEMLCSTPEDLATEGKATLPKEIDKDKALSNEDKARQELKKRYETLSSFYEKLEAIDIQELYSNALAQYYDPHTTFFSADSMEDFTISLRNSLFGIGASLSEDKGICTIREILPGGPAEESQALHAGDKILSVAQGKYDFINIQGMKLRNSIKLIRGPKGTTVRLLIQPANGEPSDRKIVELVRDEIKLENNLASAKIFYVPDGLQHYRRIGWIDLPTFYGQDPSAKETSHSLSMDVKELIERMKHHRIEGIILDMRRNGGGLLSEAIDLAGLFADACPVVQVKNALQQVDYQYAPSNACVWKGPLLILTSRFSASASEIVAGALKCCNRALLFGAKTTHGKGTVQAIIEMDKISTMAHFFSKLGALKITLQKWYLPNGQSTQLNGVASDIALPSLYDVLPIGESDLPQALPCDSVEPMPAVKLDASMTLPAGLIQYLVQNQHARAASLPAYAWHSKQVDWFEKKYKQTEFSLNLDQRIRSINEERAFRKSIDAEEKQLYAYGAFYHPLYLNGITPPRSKDKIAFDFWEYEALNLMADWLQYLIPYHWQLQAWCYLFPLQAQT